MNPGRKLDALVHLHVILGYQNSPGRRFIPESFSTDYPAYSTDIAAARQVVEKLKSMEWNIVIASDPTSYEKWNIWMSKVEIDDLFWHKRIQGQTAPHVICLAALKSVGALK